MCHAEWTERPKGGGHRPWGCRVSTGQGAGEGAGEAGVHPSLSLPRLPSPTATHRVSQIHAKTPARLGGWAFRTEVLDLPTESAAGEEPQALPPAAGRGATESPQPGLRRRRFSTETGSLPMAAPGEPRGSSARASGPLPDLPPDRQPQTQRGPKPAPCAHASGQLPCFLAEFFYPKSREVSLGFHSKRA